jgi:hypothetical protein
MAKSLKPVKPGSLAERAVLARIERVIEPAQAELIAVAQNQPRTELIRLDQARIDKWIRDRLVDWRDSCLRCRKPIVVGQKWTFVGNGEVGARFHEPCHAQWLTEQEIAARKALGLATAT